MRLHISGLQPFVGGGFAKHTTLDVEHRRKGKEMGFTKHARTAAVAAVVVASITWGAPAAQAKTVGAVAFAGETFLGCPGLGYFGAPLVTLDLSPNNCPFVTLSTISCAHLIVYGLKPGKPPAVAGLGCAVGLTGTMTGYCKYFFAKGSGVIFDATGNTITIDTFSITYSGGKGIFVGAVSKPPSGQKGFIKGKIHLSPPTAITTPAGGSCVTKSATLFPTVASLKFTVF